MAEQLRDCGCAMPAPAADGGAAAPAQAPAQAPAPAPAQVGGDESAGVSLTVDEEDAP
jgi:hypothetical protein